MNSSTKRCAIYTRKSTEEGLEQEFNSLHAQREACAAYITSQKSEGWSLVKTHYDDGGFTGSNIDRPALKKLIEDIKNEEVDIIVVYKIDRLTRSLIDFAKLVEVFDQHQVTFVSITQSFNTTTSMGRLTLNVLLSFAQFEREVISERVRDKIAASKQKGMWMGGNIPLGYDVEERKLIVNKEEAQIVQLIYNYYLKTRSVFDLKDHLDENNIRNKDRKIGEETKYGRPFSRGTLYAILSNPIYIGKTRHKSNIYDGLHAPIIDQVLWDDVQTKLTDKAVNPRNMRYDKIDILLRGKIFDCEGNRYSPSFTHKNGKRYRYYISQNLLQNRPHPTHIIARISAQKIEKVIRQKLLDLFLIKKLTRILDGSRVDCGIIEYIVTHKEKVDITQLIETTVEKIVINDGSISIYIDSKKFSMFLAENFKVHLLIPVCETYIETFHFIVRHAEKGAKILQTYETHITKNDPFARTSLELKNWVRGIVWRDEFFGGTMIADIAKREKIDPRYVGRLIDASLNI